VIVHYFPLFIRPFAFTKFSINSSTYCLLFHSLCVVSIFVILLSSCPVIFDCTSFVLLSTSLFCFLLIVSTGYICVICSFNSEFIFFHIITLLLIPLIPAFATHACILTHTPSTPGSPRSFTGCATLPYPTPQLHTPAN